MKRLLDCWPVVVAGGLLALVYVGLDGGMRAAAGGGAPKGHHDTKELYQSLKEVINRGAKIFNEAGDHAGCYRLFEGALVSVRPYLDKPLQEEVDKGLAAAAKMPSFADKAFELRRVLDLIRSDLQPVWNRLGGEDKVLAIVEDFVAAVKKDPVVDFTRGGKVKVNEELMKVEMVTLISELTGGPYHYKGKSMKEVHKGMKISEEQFRRTVDHMRDALKKNGVGAKEISVIVTAMEATQRDIVGAGEKTGEKDKKVDVKDKKADVTDKKVESKDKVDLKDKKVEVKDKKEETKDKVDLKDKKTEVKDKVKVDPRDKKSEPKDKTEAKEKAPAAEGKGEVRGKVTYDGKALSAGSIVFHETEGKGKLSGKIGADGSYSVKDVPPGKHTISISTGKGEVPPQYSDPKTSALTFRVSPGMQQLDIQLVPRKETKDEKGKGEVK